MQTSRRQDGDRLVWSSINQSQHLPTLETASLWQLVGETVKGGLSERHLLQNAATSASGWHAATYPHCLWKNQSHVGLPSALFVLEVPRCMGLLRQKAKSHICTEKWSDHACHWPLLTNPLTLSSMAFSKEEMELNGISCNIPPRATVHTCAHPPTHSPLPCTHTHVHSQPSVPVGWGKVGTPLCSWERSAGARGRTTFVCVTSGFAQELTGACLVWTASEQLPCTWWSQIPWHSGPHICNRLTKK